MVPRSSVGLGLPIFDILIWWAAWGGFSCHLFVEMLIMGLSAEAAAKKQKKKEEKEKKKQEKEKKEVAKKQKKEAKPQKKV